LSGGKGRDLRDRLACGEMVRAAGAHDGMSARLVESCGFDAVWASGFELSTSFAVPDASILTMSECLAAARTMDEAVALPVIADCDTGFGDSLNVAYMARRYEAAGVAAVCIEDKVFPKKNSFANAPHELERVDVFQQKIATAKASQRNGDLLVFARTEAFIAGQGLSEALHRAAAYVEAGADAILVHSKARTPDELFAFTESWNRPTPVVAVPTTYYGVTADELASHGVRVVIYANHAMRAGARAMIDTLREIRERGSSASVEARIAPITDLFAIQGFDEAITAPPDKDANGERTRQMASDQARSRP
jgi:phosphoenolpyruvate phosphomutase